VDDLANPRLVHRDILPDLERIEGPSFYRAVSRLFCSISGPTMSIHYREAKLMLKKKAVVRNPWTKEDLRQLKAHSKAKTPVVDIVKAMKRTEGAVRQKAKTIGLGLGHRR
jgi:hypothetical protein